MYPIDLTLARLKTEEMQSELRMSKKLINICLLMEKNLSIGTAIAMKRRAKAWLTFTLKMTAFKCKRSAERVRKNKKINKKIGRFLLSNL
jgi:hypothetical protein